MQKKVRYVVIFIVVIGVLFAALHIWAMDEFRGFAKSMDSAGAVTVTVKDYQSGRSIEINDAAVLQEICEGISDLRYNGIFLGKKRVDPGDQAYSLIISAEDFQATLIISASSNQSRFVLHPFSISIQNYDSLYQAVKTILGQESEEILGSGY